MKKAVILVLMLCICTSASAADTEALSVMLRKGLEAYDALNDYRAIFQKQERSGTALGQKETIFLKFEKPFKIFMGWKNTHKKGLQVFYERGKHDGKLAIHKPGLLLGLAPLIFLEQDSPWVKEGSASYDIEDAGIGTFLTDLDAAVKKGMAEGHLAVLTREDATGPTADVTFSGSTPGSGYFAHRVVTHFDVVTSLPDRMELYDWQGEPMGFYAYEDLRLNLGARDEDFKKESYRKIYRLFFSDKSPRARTSAG